MRDDSTTLRVFTVEDAEALAERRRVTIEAEIELLKSMRIGMRVAIVHRARLDDRGRLVACDPFTTLGEVTCLEKFSGRGSVTVHFDGEDVPTGPFSPLDVRLIDSD